MFQQQLEKTSEDLETIISTLNLNVSKYKQVDENKLKTSQTIFLIRRTRAGKLKLLHRLLKGDELETQKEKSIMDQTQQYDIKPYTSNSAIEKSITRQDETHKQSQIGHQGLACTQAINPYYNESQDIYILDTPGLYDTNDGFEEVVSQIVLHNEITLRQNIFFLFVVKFDKKNYNSILDIITRIIQ